nr:MAG TPA: hypothetical protein [Caudoviricetes sp.]
MQNTFFHNHNTVKGTVQDFKKNFLFWKRCAIIKKQTLQNCSS